MAIADGKETCYCSVQPAIDSKCDYVKLQKDALVSFVASYASIMQDWAIENIK